MDVHFTHLAVLERAKFRFDNQRQGIVCASKGAT
jgi:hypothetical protein